ncbi:GGDEF domain-containing protein [Catenovulum maritimum]|uniref:diguanylate cyclase n=1 Tax=Catenovulum maritimum TaxID=1513271 RepID=A0A0J8JKT3_9ALTE|nr:GGDEF domain-containing protein [Catenovulum maritimum]KMT65116.1 hypothetical protein XM47_10275 [Catenovulum maritimum]
MNWENIHQILEKMTSQTSVASLNAVGLNYCQKMLSQYDYRIYLNHHMHGCDELDIAYVNGSAKPEQSEIKIVKELSSGRSLMPYCFEEQGYQYICVLNDGYTLALFVFKTGVEANDVSRVGVLKTLVTIWSNQLKVLYFYQRDALTGLFNPNIFIDAISGNSFYSDSVLGDDNNLKPALERRDNMEAPSSHGVALIDIDDFKLVNNRFGHTIGDEVLIKLSKLLELSFRESDLICRYSGEEFAVLLRYVSKRTVEDVLERLRTRVEETHFPRIESITVSIGFTMTVPGILSSELIERATKAMRHGKETGKNKVISYDTMVKATGDSFGASRLEIGEIELF